MSSQILAIELTAIAHEAKRKHADIRVAADKSLADLKALPSTSEQQLAADLSRRPQFIDPFVLAACSKSTRLAGSALVCLQRLIAIRGLPLSRLHDVLDGFSAATSLSLDIQLKILQALPALAQNYSEDLCGDLLAASLHVCASLQNVKIPTVSAVAVATLQQLVVLVFDKVATEDRLPGGPQNAPVADVEVDGNPVQVRQAAHDGHRVLKDLANACDGQRLAFLDLGTLPLVVSLELLYAILSAHGDVVTQHTELIQPFKEQIVPALIRLLSDRQSFAISLRALRLVAPVIQQDVSKMTEECEVLLGLLTHLLDPDSSPPWKRALVMEVFKTLYATQGLIVQLYMHYDQQERSKAIVRDNIATFVRLSTEKPALIGLGPQSTQPVNASDENEENLDATVVEAAGGVGSATSSSVAESTALGVSAQSSQPRMQIIELLDKNEAPQIPETYIYSLTLDCLNALSDNIAKVILPLTIAHSGPKRHSRQSMSSNSHPSSADGDRARSREPPMLKRAVSYRSSTVPVNPLTMEKAPSAPQVKAIAGLLEDCWPALLATSSTFLYSALDNDYYRGLIRSVQRFTQVAGLLDLVVARDAFLTTLGKAAVPPNLSASLSGSVPPSPSFSSPSGLLSTKSLLNINNTIAQSINAATGGRRPSMDPTAPAISTRNLLCLRALINLAIALGPTLKDSFAIILGTLQHADLYLDHMQQTSSGPGLAMLATEVEAVSAAAKRMIESTSDYPNDAFKYIVDIFCTSIDDEGQSSPTASSPTEERRPSQMNLRRRASNIAAVQADSPLRSQDRLILLAKFGRLLDVNVARFVTYQPFESGWQTSASCLISVATGLLFSRSVRTLAADILCRLTTTMIGLSTAESSETGNVQKLALSTIRHCLQELLEATEHLGITDMAVFCRMLEAIKAIVDGNGENLITGWDIILDVVDMSFGQRDIDIDNEEPEIDVDVTVSAVEQKPVKVLSQDIGRLAFGITQMICSEHLSALHASYLITTSNLLYKFSRQTAETNMSLTAITLFSDVSTFLLRDNAKDKLEQLTSPQSDRGSRSILQDLQTEQGDSRAAQWMILLGRLSEVASDDRDEIRSGAFQTLIRILSEQSLDPHALRFVLTSVLFKTLEDNLHKQQTSRKQRSNDKSTAAIDEASKALIDGFARYLSANCTILVRTSQFDASWNRWVTIMSNYLDLQSHILNEAVYAGSSTILSSVVPGDVQWRNAVFSMLDAFDSRHGVPKTIQEDNDPGREQDAFLAYVSCATQITRLTEATIDLERIRSLAEHVASCVAESTLPRYGNDAISMTQVQAAALTMLRSLRTDIPGWPLYLLQIATEAVRLPARAVTEGHALSSPVRFVAYSKAAMEWLEALMKEHAADEDVIKSGTTKSALDVLGTMIKVKYLWPKAGKPPPLWDKATQCALAVLPVVASKLKSYKDQLDPVTRDNLWHSIIGIVSAIVHGDYTPLDIPNTFADIVQVEADEQSDAKSLIAVRSIILPALDSLITPLSTQRSYCQALFSASIVHPPQREELPLLEVDANPLDALKSTRHPTFDAPEVSRREDLGYLCLAELISMSSRRPGNLQWPPSSTFEEPYSPGDYGEPASQVKLDLAKAAAPYMIARFALPIKAYIADQPMRGLEPMLISRKQEFVWILERMRDLRLVKGALQDDDAKGADGNPLAHIAVLKNLLIKAVRVAGDSMHGDREILGKIMEVLDQYE